MQRTEINLRKIEISSLQTIIVNYLNDQHQRGVFIVDKLVFNRDLEANIDELH
jgi:hypothetical protein